MTDDLSLALRVVKTDAPQTVVNIVFNMGLWGQPMWGDSSSLGGAITINYNQGTIYVKSKDL